MQKQKKNPNTSLYAVCCFIDLLKKEKVYSYKSLKKYDEYNFPPTPLKRESSLQPLKMIIAATEVL